MPYACRRELQVGHNRNLYLTDDPTYVQLATGREGWRLGAKRPCQLIPSENKARLILKQLPRWAGLLTLPARNFVRSASFKWSANLSPNELLRRHAKAILSRLG